MSNVFCFEQGNCRGHEFTEKYIMNKEELVTLMEKYIERLKDTNKDERDDILEQIFEEDEDCGFDSILYLLMRGSDVFIGVDQLTIGQRLNNIKTNQSFQIICEESTFGFASSKRDAKANAYFVDNGDDW